MMDVRSLYQEMILDHGRSPRNFTDLDHPSHSAEGFNPLCGDRLKLYLKINEGVISQASFIGKGCAISTASASLMTDYLKGKTEQQAHHMFELFHDAVTQDNANTDNLGKLSVLLGVKSFPSRVKCATLAWHTLRSALAKQSEVATTE